MWGFSYDLLGKLLWITTWLFLYIYVIGNNFRYIKNKIFKAAMFSSYIFKTLAVIFIVSFYFDMFVWIFSLSFAGSIMDTVGFEINRINDSFHVETPHETIYVYISTMVHGFLLSMTTLMLAGIIYGITQLLMWIWLMKKDRYDNH